MENTFHATTIVAVKRAGTVALGGDGQVTNGSIVLKSTAHKVRKLLSGKVICGFAGSTADAFSLLERFETKLEAHKANLRRAAVELAKDWRTDRALRRLEAMLLVADKDALLLVTGQGDVIEPDDGVMAIGSGGSYALAAARALTKHTSLGPRQIVEAALKEACDLCIYTNGNVVVEELS